MGNAESSTGTAYLPPPAAAAASSDHRDDDAAREPDAYNDAEVYSSSSSSSSSVAESSSGEYEDGGDDSGSSYEDEEGYDEDEDVRNGAERGGGAYVSDDDDDGGEEDSGSSYDDEEAGASGGGGAEQLPTRANGSSAPAQKRAEEDEEDEDEVFPIPFHVDAASTDRLRSILSRLSPLTRTDVINADKILRAERRAAAASAGSSGASQGSSASDDSSSFDIMEDHVDAAMLLLGISTEIGELRFKLVPARVSEGRFWTAVFRLIRKGREEPPPVEPEKDKRAPREKEGSEPKKREAPLQRYMTKRAQAQAQAQQTSEQPQSAPASERAHSFSATSHSQGGEGGGEDRDSLRRHLRLRDEEIARLRGGLKEARARIERLEASSSSSDGPAAQARPAKAAAAATATAAAAKSTVPPPHGGKWEMDRDSADFLALDDELRSNLRREKAKRLEEVRKQMRFILDTDDVSASHGKWSCCGHTEYLGGEGCGGK